MNCWHSETGKREPSFHLQTSFTSGLFMIFLLLFISTCCQKYSNFPEATVLRVGCLIKNGHKNKNQPIARAGGRCEEVQGMTSVSQKYKRGKSLVTTQEVNQ